MNKLMGIFVANVNGNVPFLLEISGWIEQEALLGCISTIS